MKRNIKLPLIMCVCLTDNFELTSELQTLKELMKSSPLTVENKVSYQYHYLNDTIKYSLSFTIT